MLKYVLVENPMAAGQCNDIVKVDFRFFPTMVCILALMFCLSRCKSITVTSKGAKINRRDAACHTGVR
jgi:hypothetical protein